MTAYDLQLSNRNAPIKRASSDRATVQCCRLCHVEQLDQLQTDLKENVGNWAREVKPLMRQIHNLKIQDMAAAFLNFGKISITPD